MGIHKLAASNNADGAGGGPGHGVGLVGGAANARDTVEQQSGPGDGWHSAQHVALVGCGAKELFLPAGARGGVDGQLDQSGSPAAPRDF